MGVIKCVACGAAVNAEAAGCPECGGDPRTGETKYVGPVIHEPRDASSPELVRNGVALGLAVAGLLLSFLPFLGVLLSPLMGVPAVIVGVSGIVASKGTDRPTGRAVTAILLAALALFLAGVQFYALSTAEWD